MMVPNFKLRDDTVVTIPLLTDDAAGVEANAATTFEMANSYKMAAERVLGIMRTERLPLKDPIYFLYAHAAELALKALLLAHSLPIPTSPKKGHEIGEIFEACCGHKLVEPDPYFELHNLVVLLGGGNEGQRYRYAGRNKRTRPDLDWVREAVGQLVRMVEPHVTEWTKDNPSPPPGRGIIFGKPTYKKQPVPTDPGPG
jgi:hypothetical protein